MNETILITGCSSGIGFSLSQYLAAQGFKVIATIRDTTGSNKHSYASLVEARDHNGWDLLIEELDVTKQVSINDLFNKINKLKVNIDVLINNAGIAAVGLFESFSGEQVRHIMEVNFLGACNLMQQIIPLMRNQKKGLIINITSILGRIVIPNSSIYSASKFALEAVAEALKYEVEGFGIKLVTLELGTYPTGLLKKSMIPSNQHVTKFYHPQDFHSSHRTNNQELGEVLSAIAEMIYNIDQLPNHKRFVLSKNATIKGNIDYLNTFYESITQEIISQIDNANGDL